MKPLLMPIALQPQLDGLLRDVSRLCGRIDVQLCFSIGERFGLACAEAGAFGCAVVASRVDGIPGIVKHGETGYCIAPTLLLSDYPNFGGSMRRLPEVAYDPASDSLALPKFLDPEHIADAVSELMDDRDRFEGMSEAASRDVCSRFDFDKHVACVDNLFVRFTEA